MINPDGHRFVDEGEDEVWLTYAKTGTAILAQRGGRAYQLFDQKTIHLLEPRYSTGTPIEAQTVEELATQLGVPAGNLTATITAFNESVVPGRRRSASIPSPSTAFRRSLKGSP